MLKRISKKYCIYLYTFKPCIFIELWCKNNKKGQCLHSLVVIFVLYLCKNKYFACIPLNPAYLLKYKCKIKRKGQCFH